MDGNKFLSACEKGDVELVKKLLQEGEDINQIDYIGGNGLHFACRYGHYEVVILLLDGGIDINKETNGRSTPLEVTIDYVNQDSDVMLEIIRELVIRDATLDNSYEYNLIYECSSLELYSKVIDILENSSRFKPAK
jgi:ankyrin repeat protein